MAEFVVYEQTMTSSEGEEGMKGKGKGKGKEKGKEKRKRRRKTGMVSLITECVIVEFLTCIFDILFFTTTTTTTTIITAAGVVDGVAVVVGSQVPSGVCGARRATCVLIPPHTCHNTHLDPPTPPPTCL